jgi:hypothetical protein
MSTRKSTAPMFERRQYEAIADVLAGLRARFRTAVGVVGE